MPKMLVVVNDDDGSQGDSPAIPSIVVPFDIDSIHALGGIARAERLRDWERLKQKHYYSYYSSFDDVVKAKKT
jgi:hypothetical protein